MTDETPPPPEEELAGTGATEDAPFDDFEGEETKASFRELIDKNPLVKFGLIGGVLVLIIGGMIMFGGKKEKENTSVMFVPGVQSKGKVGEVVSTEYKKALEESNKQRLEKAIKENKSVLPVPTSTAQGRMPITDPGQSTEDPLERWRRIQDERTRREQEQKTGLPQADPNAQAIKDMASAMSTQMQSILATIKPTKLETKNITSEDWINDRLKKMAEAANQDKKTDGGTGGVGGPGGAGGQGGQGGMPPVEILVPAGTITYGQMVTTANSDFKQPVLGVIVGGPLAGDRIIGKFEHEKEDDYMILTFDKVIIDGISHNINAIAIDPATDASGLATDVNHHYFKRIIIPGAVAFIAGLAKGIAEPGQDTTTSTTSTVITTPKLKPAQYFWKGLGESTEKLGKEVDEQNKKTDVTVVVASGTPFGLLFIDPVTDEQSQQQQMAGSAGAGPAQ